MNMQGNPASQLATQGQQAMQAGNYHAAAQYFSQALQYAPNSDALHYHYASACSWRGQPQEALAALDRCMSLRGPWANHAMQLANTIRAQMGGDAMGPPPGQVPMGGGMGGMQQGGGMQPGGMGGGMQPGGMGGGMQQGGMQQGGGMGGMQQGGMQQGGGMGGMQQGGGMGGGMQQGGGMGGGMQQGGMGGGMGGMQQGGMGGGMGGMQQGGMGMNGMQSGGGSGKKKKKKKGVGWGAAALGIVGAAALGGAIGTGALDDVADKIMG